MKVAILGGGSCFSLNLANLLEKKGIEHFGIGRSGRKPPAMWTVDHHYRYHQAHVVTQLPAVMAILDTEKPDVIVNIAAQGEGAASFAANAPDFFMTNCVAISRLVIELKHRDYLKRFIQIGSSEIYGSVDHAARETDPHRPGSPYGISKAAFDQYLGIMHRVSGFPMNIVLPSNAYCDGQQLHRIIPKALLAGMTGRRIPLQGGGAARKSYMHADDLSKAILLVAEKAPLGETYNAGPSWPIAIKDVVSRCAIECGMSLAELADIAPDRVGQDSQYWLNSQKLRALGWKPGVDLRDGIHRVAQWVKSNLTELSSMSDKYEHRK